MFELLEEAPGPRGVAGPPGAATLLLDPVVDDESPDVLVLDEVVLDDAAVEEVVGEVVLEVVVL